VDEHLKAQIRAWKRGQDEAARFIAGEVARQSPAERLEEAFELHRFARAAGWLSPPSPDLTEEQERWRLAKERLLAARMA
jgi:hypothetical protein